MLLSDLPFPVTVVAPDGWARYEPTHECLRAWGVNGIRQYNRIGFIVADAEGMVWRLVQIVPERELSFWERLGFRSGRIPVRIVIEAIGDDPIAVFREHFLVALAKDDDCLTQFHSAERIKRVLGSTDSIPRLMAALHKMGVT